MAAMLQGRPCGRPRWSPVRADKPNSLTSSAATFCDTVRAGRPRSQMAGTSHSSRVTGMLL
jgi:hypothetical protein